MQNSYFYVIIKQHDPTITCHNSLIAGLKSYVPLFDKTDHKISNKLNYCIKTIDRSNKTSSTKQTHLAGEFEDGMKQKIHFYQDFLNTMEKNEK